MALNQNPSNLDQTQIIQRVMDGANDRLRVDATVTATIGDVVINANDSSVAIGDQSSGNLLTVNADGSIDVNTITSATSGDSILSVGTADGTIIGAQHVIRVNIDGNQSVLAENSIVPFKFDSILPSYPTSTKEIYLYKELGSTVATVTVDYVDASKNEIVSIVRT